MKPALPVLLKRKLSNLGAIIVAGSLGFLSGCAGVPSQGETIARKDAAVIGKYFKSSSERSLPASPTLSNYLSTGLQNSPRVRAAYFDWAAAVNRITVERSLPDPKLAFSMDIQDVVMGVMPGLMMEFPGPGKLKGAAALALAESDASYYKFKQEALRAAFEIKSAYYSLAALEQRISIYARLNDLLAEVSELARSQAATSRAGLEDVLRSDIEREILGTELAALRESRSAFAARFKAALGLTHKDPAPSLPIDFNDSEPIVAFSLTEALLSNPNVAQMEAEVRAAEASLLLARRGKVPDFSLGLEADAWATPTIFTPEIGMSLPIWRDKISASIAQAQARKAATDQRLTAEQITVAVELAERSFMVKEAELTQKVLIDKAIPKAEQLLDVLRVAYAANRASFLDLREAQRGLLQFHLQKIEASYKMQTALAELSLLIAGVTPPSFPLLPTSEEPNNKSTKGKP